MNTQLEKFDIKVEGHQVVEAVASIFHSVLFHRCLGKFSYNQDGSYYEKGTVGFMEVDCDFIDLTYIACSSETLNKKLLETIVEFSNELRGSDGVAMPSGEISLEFFEKKKRLPWQFYPGIIPWEMWRINIELMRNQSEADHIRFREELNEILTDKLIHISKTLCDRPRYLPEMPKEDELDNVFDTSYPDVNPYNFKVSYVTQNCRSLIKNTIQQLFYRTILN